MQPHIVVSAVEMESQWIRPDGASVCDEWAPLVKAAKTKQSEPLL